MDIAEFEAIRVNVSEPEILSLDVSKVRKLYKNYM